MSCIDITHVQILDNPAPFTNPFQFEISFECTRELQEDLEWKVIYVGSAESEAYDQILDSILLGPIKPGINKFVFQVDPPDAPKIPKEDLLEVTVILLTCSYKNREFIRVGYYVNNEYADPELRLNPPPVPDITKIQRNILAASPRVTRFQIPWDDPQVFPIKQEQQPPFPNQPQPFSTQQSFPFPSQQPFQQFATQQPFQQPFPTQQPFQQFATQQPFQQPFPTQQLFQQPFPNQPFPAEPFLGQGLPFQPQFPFKQEALPQGENSL